MFDDLDIQSPPEWDRILSASQKNNAAEIRRLIEEEGVPSNHSNVVGQTALHIASLWGSVEALQELIAHNANPNAQNKLAGMTPLHCAIRGTFQSFKETHTKRIQCVALLLEAGADATTCDSKGKDIFEHLKDMVHEAQLRGLGDVQFEMKEMKDALLMGGAGVERSKLSLCIENGDVEGVKNALLEEEGVSQKEKNLGISAAVERFTLLINEGSDDKSSLSSSTDIIQCLLESGVDPNTNNNSMSQSQSPLEGAPLHTICSCICSTYSSPSTSTTFATPFATQIIQSLLQHGAEIITETKLLLPNAAHRGRLGAVQFLVQDVGIDPNFRGRQGMTSLHFAARSGKVDVVTWLLDYVGESMDDKIVDDAGKKAIDYASANGKQEIVDLLLKKR